MANYDLFNGDADGICSLVQLRLAEPRDAQLVTGVKRDIALLDKINPKKGDQLTVLDISMRNNAKGLTKALQNGADVYYVDHHNPGDIPSHDNLFAVIDTRPDICTALLVNKCLNGVFAEWAVVAAFGDNMAGSAHKLAEKNNLGPETLSRLKKFGELINYNGYGRTVDDLHFKPDDLFRSLVRFETPSECLIRAPHIYEQLDQGYDDDLARARNTQFISKTEKCALVTLDDAPWARRISGSYGNVLAASSPDRAHAVLTHNQEASFTVSVRAPRNNPKGADQLCLQFPTGGGRSAAAGINDLPHTDLEIFTDAFNAAF
ncbi:MAG: DHH family phosphoesterase [Acidimicrobiales bacterium]|nr:DHH family phosphoesterase [Hyphomonadaceae bacterium]RZV44048.1 MAG: DHH family phosphoesterase [Acidimicrobiales bacterium]